MAATHVTLERRRVQVLLAQQGRRAHRAARVEDYQELRSWGLTRAQAAWRLGVSYRTVMRYEVTLRGPA
jgi:hypothetical protein